MGRAMKTYNLHDTVIMTDTDEIGSVAKIINIASDSYELEFEDGECGWYDQNEFELAGGEMKQTKLLTLINNLTTYEKLELVNLLIHSDQVQISLDDDQAGVKYEQKDSPYYPPVEAYMSGQTIMLRVDLDEFEPSAYQSSEIADQYGKSRLVSTPTKGNS